MNKMTQEELIWRWKQVGGYYLCPRDGSGKRIGPLVGYAGTYKDGDQDKHFVGDAYFNFAKVEEDSSALNLFAEVLALAIRDFQDLPGNKPVDWVLGAPMGGIALACTLSHHLGCKFLYAEKKVTKAASRGEREESVLALVRHEIPAESNGFVTEDVVNNYSTTQSMIDLIEDGCDAHCSGITCGLNRSNQTEYRPRQEGNRPVIAALHIPTPQYRQDDDAVAGDIAAGNVAWKPKAEWAKLMRAMEIGAHMMPGTVV